MMKLEYKGYILEIEEVYKEGKFSHFTTKKDSNLGLITGIWKSCTLDFLINRFKQNVNSYLAREMKTFEYKGYLLKLGLIEDTHGQKRKGGRCEALDYKTYGNDEEANITKFKKFINWKISEEKKQVIPNSLERIEKKLDRLIELLEKKEKPQVNPFPEYQDSPF